MAKLTLSDLVNLQNEQSAVGTINANSDAIVTALENTLSRDGTTPNSMSADLDMNSNSILNLPAPTEDTEPLRLGDLPDILPTIIVQDAEPATSFTEGSLWIDSNSTDYDLYQLTSGVWTDTTVNIEGAKGDTGDTGATGATGDTQDIFVQNTAPATDGLEGSLWIDADSTDYDLFQLQSAVWVDTGVNLKGIQGIQGDPGINWMGAWQAGTYNEFDAVENDGSSYIANTTTTAEPPHADWDTLAEAGADGAGAGNVNTGTAPVVSGNLVLYTGTDGNTIDDSGIVAANVVVDSDITNMLETTDIGTTVQGFDVDTLKADTADVLTAGFATTVFNAGTQSGAGTYTPDEANGNFQRAVNGGAHTLAPPTNDCNIVVQYTNDASAGTITTSGFTIVTGNTLTTTDGHDFLMYITKINGFSHLNVVSFQ